MFRYTIAATALALLANAGSVAAQQTSKTAVSAAGPLEISAPFARATLPNQPVAGGFMTITNTGKTDDVLVGASSDAAGRMEIHEMAMQGHVMRMRELADGLTIPAGETVTLAPGGYHVMFMDLTGPLEEGDAIDLTLRFEQAGDVDLTMPVLDRTAKSAVEGN